MTLDLSQRTTVRPLLLWRRRETSPVPAQNISYMNLRPRNQVNICMLRSSTYYTFKILTDAGLIVLNSRWIITMLYLRTKEYTHHIIIHSEYHDTHTRPHLSHRTFYFSKGGGESTFLGTELWGVGLYVKPLLQLLEGVRDNHVSQEAHFYRASETQIF